MSVWKPHVPIGSRRVGIDAIPARHKPANDG